MRADRLTSLRVAAVLTATAILGLITIGPAQQARASFAPIVGAGSTYAYPALEQWGSDMTSQGLAITYTPNGSAAGRQQYAQAQLDFAGSDIAYLRSPDPFAGSDNSQYAYSYIPDVAGGLSFLYNLQVNGQKIRNMRLTGGTIAKIFTGQITNWDDPAITHDYGAQLPSTPITVVTRSDGAGESYFLTNWMLDQYKTTWVNYCKARGGGSLCDTNPTEDYPVPAGDPHFKSLNGADEVAGYINSAANNGAIGYAEESYAKPNNIPVVSVANAAGYYQQPTAANVAVSLHAAIINNNVNDVNYLMQDLTPVYGDKDPRTYPLSSYSYLVVPRDSRPGFSADSFFSNAKGTTLSTFINYILCQAQASAASLGYSPLPDVMVTGGFLQEAKIPGAVASPAAQNYSNCHNPAFYNGKNVLLASAPQPSPCQKVTAPLNCVVSNGKPVSAASNANSNSNSNNTNSNNSGTNGTNSSTNSKTPGRTGSTAGPPGSASNSIDPNTGLPSNGNNGTTSANPYVSAQPVAFAGRPTERLLFGVLTAIVLFAVVLVPVLLGVWLERDSWRRRPAPGPWSGPPPPPPPNPALTRGER